MIIYKATNTKNGKSYIGQTSYNLECRKNTHLSEAKKDNLPFHNALLKYKKDFKWRILEYCTSKKEMDEMEFHYIKQYNTLFPNGYNLTWGGEGNLGWVPTKENRKNMSEARKKWWSDKDEDYKKQFFKKVSTSLKGNKGCAWSKGLTKETDERIMKISIRNKNKKLTEEHKQKIGNSVRGKKQSIETKEKIRQRQLGENNSFYGRTHDPETIKNKMTFYGEDNPFYGKTHTKESLEKKSRNLYEITYPDGHKETTKVFSLWCRENNISKYKLRYESNKGRFYKDYFMRKVDIMKEGKEKISNYMSIEMLFTRLYDNYIDLYNELKKVRDDCIINGFSSYKKRNIYLINIQTKLINFLNTTAEYPNKVPELTSLCSGNSKEDIKKFFSEEYDSNKNYQLVVALRNHFQHYHNNYFLFTWKNERVEDVIESKVVLLIKKSYLENNKKFKKSILINFSEKIDLIKVINSYMESVLKIHKEIQKINDNSISLVIKSLEEQKNKLDPESLDHFEIRSLLEWYNSIISLQQKHYPLFVEEIVRYI